jgi:2-oxoglutarate dehydrogenase E1 component
LEDFAEGEFQEVIDDNVDPSKVSRVVFCSGKFYYDLLEERNKNGRTDVALIRIEQLFPLHEYKIEKILSKYTLAEDHIWAQEEPRNMGAWSYMLQRFELKKLDVRSRLYYAVPAAGSSARFKKRQRRVIESVFDNIKK